MTETSNSTDDHANDHSSGGHGTKNRYDDIPVSKVLYFGVIAVICTLLAFLFVKGLLNWWTNGFEAQRRAEVVESSANIEIAKQKKVLEGVEGSISIEEASKKVLEQYGSSH